MEENITQLNVRLTLKQKAEIDAVCADLRVSIQAFMRAAAKQLIDKASAVKGDSYNGYQLASLIDRDGARV